MPTIEICVSLQGYVLKKQPSPVFFGYILCIDIYTHVYIPNCKPFHIYAHIYNILHIVCTLAIFDWIATPKAHSSFKSHYVSLRSKQIDCIPHNFILHQFNLSILFRTISYSKYSQSNTFFSFLLYI